MNSSRKNFLEAILFFLIVSCLGYFFYAERISLFPSFIHAWTQSDRYALALGFLNNGFDFFHPQTFNLVTTGGITQVDFPIHEYSIALLMKISGVHEPIVFRLYTFVYGISGLYFLFRLTKFFGGTFFNALFVSLFVFCCPVFTYYLGGFLPSIPSFSNCIIAFYFFFRYKSFENKKLFSFAILFFTLAALARTPFVIFLFAAFCVQLFFYLKNKKWNRFELSFFLSGFSFMLLYYFYNKYLGKKFGSQFLTEVRMPTSLSELKEIFLSVKKNWCFEYFTKLHYVTLVIFLATLIFSALKKVKTNRIDVAFYLWISFAGATCFFLLMAKQFPDHDYYFIDSFYPIVALFLAYSVGEIQPKIISVAMILIPFLIRDANKSIAERYTFQSWDRAEITRQNFRGTEKYLDSIGIPKSAKILVLDSYTTNTALALMNRQGYTVIWTTEKNIKEGLSKPFDYVAIQNCFLVDGVIKNYPAIITQLEKFADNGLVSFYRRKNNPLETFSHFFGITSENTLYHFATDFKSDSLAKGWNKFTITAITYFSEPTSLFVDKDDEFSPSLKLITGIQALRTHPKILIMAKIICEAEPQQQVVAALKHGDVNYYYSSFSLRDYISANSEWQNLMMQFVLPEIKENGDEMSVYFWNPKKQKYCLDDLELTIYR